MKKQSVKMAAVVVAFLSTIAITACGGGGGSSGTPEATPTPAATSVPTATPVPATPTATPVATTTPAPGTLMTGKFIDSPVEGLYYETATQSGYTSRIGEFNYLQGETVRFKLYGTWLNTNAGSVILTPADAQNVSIDYSVNLLRLLQTLDMDSDPSNGIKLPTVANGGIIAVNSYMETTTTFNLDQDIYAFEKDLDVIGAVSELTYNGYTRKTELVPIKQALAHFNASIIGADTGEVVLDLSGKKVSMTVSDNRCAAGTGVNTKPTTYEFVGGSVTETMYESSVWGIANNTALGTGACKITDFSSAPAVKTSVMANMTNTMNTFYHGPVFTYKNMNRIGIRANTVDPVAVNNGLESIVVIWHTPGTKKITYQRRYLKPETGTTSNTLYTLTWVYTWE